VAVIADSQVQWSLGVEENVFYYCHICDADIPVLAASPGNPCQKADLAGPRRGQGTVTGSGRGR
jgi:hypothetical protein